MCDSELGVTHFQNWSEQPASAPAYPHKPQPVLSLLLFQIANDKMAPKKGLQHRATGIVKPNAQRRAVGSSTGSGRRFLSRTTSSRRSASSGAAAKASSGKSPARPHIFSDDDDEEEDLDYEYHDRDPEDDVAEEYDEDADPDPADSDGDDSVTSGQQAGRRTSSGGNDDRTESSDDEQAGGLGEDLTMKQILSINARALQTLLKQQADALKLIARFVASSAAAPRQGQAAARAASPGAAAARRHPARPAALPLDGVDRLFGSGFRKRVVAAIAPLWFKLVGTQHVLLPYNTIVPVVMRACSLDPDELDERKARAPSGGWSRDAPGSPAHAQLLCSAACRRLPWLLRRPRVPPLSHP